MKKYIVMFAITIFMVSFNSDGEENLNKMIENGSTAPYSQSWSGIYVGILPCPNCHGAKTTLVLNRNGSYELNISYLNSKNLPVKTLSQIGEIEWDQTYPAIIHLKNQQEQMSFLVGSKQVILYDNHQPIESKFNLKLIQTTVFA